MSVSSGHAPDGGSLTGLGGGLPSPGPTPEEDSLFVGLVPGGSPVHDKPTGDAHAAGAEPPRAYQSYYADV